MVDVEAEEETARSVEVEMALSVAAVVERGMTHSTWCSMCNHMQCKDSILRLVVEIFRPWLHSAHCQRHS